jgi:dTDP-glucose 4,6-dehydratase
MKLLVTGGAGFIGSCFVKLALEKQSVERVVNLDKLTYAGNLSNLESVSKDPRYRFVRGDIADPGAVERIYREGIDAVVNFAAETHVDRSIRDAGDFITTDVQGVFVLLEAARKHGIEKFIQISTDEVYGSISEGAANESFPLMPSNPYSASKAGGDRLAYSFFKTFDLPVIVTRASNNYGPFQYPEKIIPLFITNALEGRNLPMYGDGLYRRDWIHVCDHCEAVWFLLEHGMPGQTYNIGGGNECTNRDLTEKILEYLGLDWSRVETVRDRPGHDRRYALDCAKLRALGWTPSVDFDRGLLETIDWYRDNAKWWEPIKSGEYRNYYLEHYGTRS